jgi:hypothetical protein
VKNGNKYYEGDPFLTLFSMLTSKVHLFFAAVVLVHFCVFQLLLKMKWDIVVRNIIKVVFASIALMGIVVFFFLIIKSSKLIFRDEFKCSRSVAYVAFLFFSIYIAFLMVSLYCA